MSDHSTDKPTPRVRIKTSFSKLLLESVTVIFSILAAFAINAWWADRQADKLEQNLLHSMESGFLENRLMADEVISEAYHQQALIGRFMAMTPFEAEAIPEDSVYIFLRALWRPNYYTRAESGATFSGGLNSASLTTTLNAGRLSLLSDSRLIEALANWQASVQDLEQRSGEVVEMERRVLEVIAKYPALQAVLGGFDSQGEVAHFRGETPKMSGKVAREVRADLELMGRVTVKGLYSRIQVDFLEGVAEHADSVLVLIRENINK